MKKSIAMLLVLILLAGAFGTLPAFAADGGGAAPPLPPQIKDGVSVAAIFAAPEAQPFPASKDEPEDMEPIMVDTVWVYFSDNSFDQYAETPKGFELFSTGTYSFKDGGSFALDNGDDHGVITIERTQKFSGEEKKVVAYASTHDYKLGTLGFSQLFGPGDGREVEAVFGDDHCVTYQDENGVLSSLDALWIYFSDGSFVEYAFLNGEVVRYGKGTYEFDDAGDFHIAPFEEDYGTISQTWEESLGGFAGETLTFDLGATGLNCLYEKLDAVS